MEYQLIIIGSGPGGYEAALRSAELGMKTALIEKQDIGGTCLNRGCIPTKALLHASESVVNAGDAARFGISTQVTNIDLPKLFHWKREISATLRSGVEGLLEQAGVDVYRGVGTLQGPGRVKVSGQGETTELNAEYVLLASGSVPARPSIPGLELEGVVTSDELLEGADALYPTLVIIGGGVIGVEIATCYSNLGTHVTIIEGMSRLLPNLDRELGQNITTVLKKRGVDIRANAKVTRITKETDGTLTVNYKMGGEKQSVTTTKVLCAIGRTPCLEGLLDDGVILEREGRRIKVDENYQTSLPGVYAIGDSSSPIQLAHMATAQGRNCVERLAGKKPAVRADVVPSCIYCSPEIACVGMTADETKAANIRAVTAKYVMFGNGRTLIADAPRSFIKVVADRESHCIIGAQLMCERATDMISEFTSAIVNGLTAEELLCAMRPHPTFEEGTNEVLRELIKKF